MPQLELLPPVALNPRAMRREVPATVDVFEPGLRPGPVVSKGPLDDSRVISADGTQEIYRPPRTVDVDRILDEVMHLEEKLEVVDESPVSAQTPVRREAQRIAASIRQVGGRVDEGHDARARGVRPGTGHEVPIEVRLRPRDLGIHRSGADELCRRRDVARTGEHR